MTVNSFKEIFYKIVNHKYYENLALNIDDCLAKDYFVSNGFLYYFKGSVPLGKVLGDKEELVSHGWEVLYESGDSYLFKIPTCK